MTLRGAAKKKKAYTTPKKKKHKRKNVKLAVLKYCSKVDENGKIIAFVRSALQMNVVLKLLCLHFERHCLWQTLSDLLLQQTGRLVIVYGLIKDMN